ncbi:hypothetical protein AMK21_32255 [Streptomyces sp. CB00316]|uniref:hypothetical protein n=1 Tax=Streptomyces sp. CB00316 TaxID=1703932 RepID=UPI0009404C32|nr:hypothetical protein [Streptomyces sp. CB00316]OKJ06896.1 hypothetical protein AMK21_32255 [Streptomyces sp. CB00316]
MTAERPGKGPRRRARQTGTTRTNRVNMSFDDTELEVILTAAGRDGQMALGAWAARQVIAVAQHTLIPLSADTGDVLRELIRSRIHLQETVATLHTLTAPPAPPAPFPVSAGTHPDGSRAAVANTPAPALPDQVRTAVEEALGAIVRVDAATVQLMRERRSRT